MQVAAASFLTGILLDTAHGAYEVVAGGGGGHHGLLNVSAATMGI